MATPKKAPKQAATTKKRTARTRSTKPARGTVTVEQAVAERAYYLWLEGNGANDLERWTQAERDLAVV
jgi:hypothetical protein